MAKRINGEIAKDAAGNVILEEGKIIMGIDFSKKPTGRELLGYFTNNLEKEFSKKFGGAGLKDSRGSGLQSRLGQEAVETGLIRYLENNPEKVFTKDDLINVASLFNPNIKVNVYSRSEQDSLVNRQGDLLLQVRNLDPTNPNYQKLTDELTVVNSKLEEYEDSGPVNPWSYEGLQNLKVADLGTPTSPGLNELTEANQDLIRKDSHTFLFSLGDESKTFLGKSINKTNTNETDNIY